MKKTTEYWQAHCLNINKEMADHVQRYITPISLEIDSDGGELIGTGNYIRLGNAVYILTNEHVARAMSAGSLAHLPVPQENFHRMVNPFMALEYPNDIALSRLDRLGHDVFSRAVIQKDQIAHEWVSARESLYFVMGFPGSKSYMSVMANTLFTPAVPFLTQEAPLLPSDISLGEFALHYPEYERLKKTNGREESLPNPSGMSGSLVWHIGNSLSRYWSPADARVVGLLYGWDPKHEIIRGIKIESIRHSCIYLLRQECAYFRWLDGGRRSCSLLFDWLYAEGSIADI